MSRPIGSADETAGITQAVVAPPFWVFEYLTKVVVSVAAGRDCLQVRDRRG